MFLTATVVGLGLILGEASHTPSPKIGAVAEKAFAKLPGSHGFLFTELTPQGPRKLYGQNENQRFAIGSGFKLYILGTLAVDLNAHTRELSNTTTLRPDWVGPPHSELAEWPIGAPVTLSTLALKMISISDNTATDHLIHLLGRKSIEQQMTKMGNQHSDWNIPLLTTREMAMLRDRNTGLPGRQYQKLDEAKRREFLLKHYSGKPDYDQLDFDTAQYDTAEWYATPMDMARAMAWLQQNTMKDQPAHPLRAILAVETKMPIDAKIWPYAGFKGGSEAQLLAGNWLLQHRNGRWYTFHVFCNSPQQKLDGQTMLQGIEQLFTALQDTVH